jgi:hypothetical protein
MRKASPRLGPRSDQVEEQATEGHADRERVEQLVFTSLEIPGSQVVVKDPGTGLWGHRPDVQD